MFKTNRLVSVSQTEQKDFDAVFKTMLYDLSSHLNKQKDLFSTLFVTRIKSAKSLPNIDKIFMQFCSQILAVDYLLEIGPFFNDRRKDDLRKLTFKFLQDILKIRLIFHLIRLIR